MQLGKSKAKPSDADHEIMQIRDEMCNMKRAPGETLFRTSSCRPCSLCVIIITRIIHHPRSTSYGLWIHSSEQNDATSPSLISRSRGDCREPPTRAESGQMHLPNLTDNRMTSSTLLAPSTTECFTRRDAVVDRLHKHKAGIEDLSACFRWSFRWFTTFGRGV